MRARKVVWGAGLVAAVLVLFGAVMHAQTTTKDKPAAAKTAAPAVGPGKPVANLAQLMRGILFPNSNIVFAVQSIDPTTVKKDEDPTAAINPLAGSFGGWAAVENASLSLVEVANLLSEPGRVCSNGKPVPIHNADWPKYVQGLRDAGMASYKAAQAKSMDQILDAADKLTNACSNCHMVYREKTDAQGGLAGRCTK
jgi:hypothetical protein